jgi:hypothetical protein
LEAQSTQASVPLGGLALDEVRAMRDEAGDGEGTCVGETIPADGGGGAGSSEQVTVGLCSFMTMSVDSLSWTL